MLYTVIDTLCDVVLGLIIYFFVLTALNNDFNNGLALSFALAIVMIGRFAKGKV